MSLPTCSAVPSVRQWEEGGFHIVPGASCFMLNEASAGPLTTFLVCRQCQLVDYKEHKKTCGTLVLPSPDLAPRPATINSSEPPLPPQPTWLYLPSPLSPPQEMILTPPTARLLPYLLRSASSPSDPPNALPIILLFSLLLPFVLSNGGTEERLIQQLGKEYNVDLEEALDSEADWEEDALWGVVGLGSEARQALLGRAAGVAGLRTSSSTQLNHFLFCDKLTRKQHPALGPTNLPSPDLLNQAPYSPKMSDRSPFSKSILVLGGVIFTVTGLSLFFRESDGFPHRSGSGEITGPFHHLVASSSASTPQPCRWVFEKYEASELEREWHSNRDWQTNTCAKLAETQQADWSTRIVSRVMELFARPPGGSIEGDVETDNLFSRLEYRRECWAPDAREWERTTGIGRELIEPLWGMLRDPFDLYCGQDLRLHVAGWTGGVGGEGQSKAHILPSSMAPWTYSLDNTLPPNPTWSTGSPPWQRSIRAVEDPDLGTTFERGKNVYYDLGSSYFNVWTKAQAAGSGAWFYDTFTTRAGLHFDKFVCVELESLSPDEAYKQLPADLVGAYTLMNVGLDTEKGSKLNAIDLLTSITKPGDFLAFKLDIDSAPIELPIAHALRDDKELASRVSELMFEHHVDIPAMRSSWGYYLKEDLMDSYKLFTALRENGIRAHSWP
ncbi:hypothetical protein P7C70_g7885, partial [Phenoliferia sp. Uapishka_3]